jgi:hypothetical protein
MEAGGAANPNVVAVNTVVTTEGCVTFHDESAPVRVGATTLLSVLGDFKPPVGDATDRPLRIATATMGGGASLSIQPWTLLRNNAAFKRVLGSCVGFTGVLHLRVSFATNPYIYGAINYYLDPASSFGGTTLTYDDRQVSWDSEYAGHVDIALNQVSELVIPHFGEQPFMLATSDTLTNYITIKFIEVSTITDVSTGIATTADMQVYAWVSDLQRVGISPQSAEFQPDRVVSSSLTILSESARTIARIPILSPFATAVSIFADMGAKVAAALGFSRPTDVRDPSMMLMRNTRLAPCTGLDDSEPLGLDPKQQRELRHGHVTGHGIDQLSMAYMISRTGHLTTVAWATDDPVGSPAEIIPVNPCTCATLGNAWKLTPLAVLALPFARWRGTLQYTFVVHCSRFHRGRLRAYWASTSGGYADNPSNTAFITYLDILPGATMTVSAPYVANNYFLATYLNDVSLGPITSEPSAFNGYIILEVDQPLTCPAANGTVVIHTFVKACNDFELARPSVSTLPLMNIASYNGSAVPVSWPALDGGATADSYIAPPAGVVTPIVQQSGCAPAEVIVQHAPWLYGESTSTCRDLMKRYTPWDYRQIAVTTEENYVINRVTRCPQFPTQTNSAVFNPISWYTMMFGFNSGGVRHKIHNPDSSTLTGSNDRSVIVSRVSGDDINRIGTVSRATVVGVGLPAVFPFSTLAQAIYRKFLVGGALFPADANIQGVVIPDVDGLIITNNKVCQTAQGDTCVDFAYVMGATDKSNYVVVLASIGEDYNCHVFFGAPRLYVNQRVYNSPPG